MNANNVTALLQEAKPDEIKPIPLQRELPPSQDFPVDALGVTLEGAVKKIAEVIQAPVGICAQSVLAAVSLAVQGHVDIEIDGRVLPLSQFFLTIGATGERKSAVDNVALLEHRKLQSKLICEHKDAMKLWLKSKEVYEHSKKDVLKGVKGYLDTMAAFDSLGPEPEKPLDPILLTEEPTYEGLIKLLITGQPSIGLFSDEGGRFIGGHGMNNDNLLKTAAGLCGLWDGKQVTRVRAGDASTILTGRRVSFHLMVQPNVAQMMLSNSLLIEQGLMSRCLVCWPESTAGKRLYKSENLTKCEELIQFSIQVSKILSNKMLVVPGSQNELSPRRIILSGEAKDLFIEFHDSIEPEIGDGGKYNSIRGFANKAPEHALRLAGVIEFFHDPEVTEITFETMFKGIELATYYLNETLRVQNSSIADSQLAKAQKLLEWLQLHKEDKEITLVEIYQKGPSFIRSAKLARESMSVLESHRWVLPIKGGAEFDGALREEAWVLVT